MPMRISLLVSSENPAVVSKRDDAAPGGAFLVVDRHTIGASVACVQDGSLVAVGMVQYEIMVVGRDGDIKCFLSARILKADGIASFLGAHKHTESIGAADEYRAGNVGRGKDYALGAIWVVYPDRGRF